MVKFPDSRTSPPCPNPKDPLPLKPHAQSVPLVFTASVCPKPELTFCQLVNVPTCVGLDRLMMSFKPSRPLEFWPQLHRVPSSFTATAKLEPADILVHVRSCGINDGTVRVTAFPKPSWPFVLSPQLQRVFLNTTDFFQFECGIICAKTFAGIEPITPSPALKDFKNPRRLSLKIFGFCRIGFNFICLS